MKSSLPFPKLDDALIERLIPLAEDLDDLASSGADCSRGIAQFNALAGTAIHDPIAFHFSGTCDAKAFVRDVLATTYVPRYAGLAEDVLLGIIASIQDGDRPGEASFWMRVLELNLPGAPISALIFHPSDVPDLAAGSPSGAPSPEDVLRAAQALAWPNNSATPPTRAG